MSDGESLPPGWASATLGELCEINPKHARDHADAMQVSFVPMAAVDEELGEITSAADRPYGTVRKGYTHFADDDVLWAKITPCMENGKSAVARGLTNGIGCGTTEFFVLRSRGAVLPEYLHRFMRQRSYRAAARQTMQSGVGQARVPADFIERTILRVPPLAEQRRIVATLGGLLASSRATRAALDVVRALLQQYRRAVLSAAFRGDLTAGWRELQPRQQTISSVCDADPARRDRTPPAASRPAYLPESWSWERLGALGLAPDGAVQTGPFGAQLHSDEFVPAGVPVIAVGNLTGIGFTTDKLYHITPAKAAALARYDVQAGDLLFARSGATLGKVCVAPPEVRDWRMTGHILRARLAQDLIDPQLVAYALWGDPLVTQQVIGGIRGMTRPGYNTSLLEAIAIPVPPRDEQIEIVSRIRDAFQRIDGVGQLIVHLQDRRAALEEATLAKAFRGELVMQDATDEPADDMLARVREARSAPARAPRRRKAGRP